MVGPLESFLEAFAEIWAPRAEKLRTLEVSQAVLAGPSTKWVLPTSGDLVNVLNLEGKSGSITPIKSKQK